MSELAFGALAILIVGTAILAIYSRLSYPLSQSADFLGIALWWYGTFILSLGLVAGSGGLVWATGFLLLRIAGLN